MMNSSKLIRMLERISGARCGLLAVVTTLDTLRSRAL